MRTRFKVNIGSELIQGFDLQLIQELCLAKNISFTLIESEEVEEEVMYTPVRTVAEKMQFGDKLRLIFNQDNNNAPISFSPALAEAIYTKFQTVEFLCRNGDLKNVKSLLMNMPVDPVFTQARKDKYITLIDNFVNFID